MADRMDNKKKTKVSKYLSFVLRHQPDAVGITLDPQGWVDVETLLRACSESGRTISRSELEDVVSTSPKQRFAFSGDGQRIRASQGHSTAVDLGYAPATPPGVLFHGTPSRFIAAIREKGLLRMQRHHVHLAADEETARSVGARRGNPVILRVDARAMSEAGHTFFCTDNGVWLTETVPARFISNWS